MSSFTDRFELAGIVAPTCWNYKRLTNVLIDYSTAGQLNPCPQLDTRKLFQEGVEMPSRNKLVSTYTGDISQNIISGY